MEPRHERPVALTAAAHPGHAHRPGGHACDVAARGGATQGHAARAADAAPPVRLDPDKVLEVLVGLQRELRGTDPELRAVVGLRAAAGSIALVDVPLRGNGVLDPPVGTGGLVVVTSEEVAHGEEVVGLHQIVAVLAGGAEIGLYRVADGGRTGVWRTDVDDDTAAALRPRDLAANSARRAFGLPSLVEGPMPVAELLARAWLLAVAGEALDRFDGPDGPRDVEIDELLEVAAAPPLGGLTVSDGVPPSWEQVHAAAVAGDLELGPFTVEPSHAAWLDPHGLAQLLERTLPPIEELLASLRVTANDEGLAWAIEQLLARGWHRAD
jgi:hypothetical protein